MPSVVRRTAVYLGMLCTISCDQVSKRWARTEMGDPGDVLTDIESPIDALLKLEELEKHGPLSQKQEADRRLLREWVREEKMMADATLGDEYEIALDKFDGL